MSRERLLVYYDFDQPDSFSGSITPIPLTLPAAGALPTEIPLATVNLNLVRPHDRVRLAATVGWRVVAVSGPFSNEAELEFRIRRGGTTGVLVSSARDSGFPIEDFREITTKFLYTEGGISHSVQYTLSVVLVNAPGAGPGTTPAQIIGPIHFEGSVIDDNST
ncbi:hypothetical protein [Brevibacillus massiliensis]|uniref:hypothetical protein n=1 Tax=Brevibacillus massiliensis TaxID=1118054 RepID=UPI0002EEBE61|nr:hypothetical protein [Brevibacillus massiliensis]